MSELTHYLASETATVAAGAVLGNLFTDGIVLYLEGTLGAGKTTLCRGVLRAFGHSGAVKSPTYTLVEPYELESIHIYHFDLYRLGDAEELEYMGIRDYFQAAHVCLIEWPAKGQGFLPDADLIAKVLPEGTGRNLTLIAASDRGRKIIDRFQGWQPYEEGENA